MKQYTYKCIRVQLDNNAEVTIIGKRAQYFTQYAQLNIGGLYFLRTNALFRVLELKEEHEFE